MNDAQTPPTAADGPMMTAALAYAARGWPVFPLKPRDKTPATAHGVKDATTDPTVIRQWWSAQPDCNIGLGTGSASGLCVIDLDGPEGEKSAAALNLPTTRTSRTARGRHLVYRAPAWPVRNSASKIGPGVDVRGDGGYIVAPPSVHPSGDVYRWESEADPAPWPLPAPEQPRPAAPQPAPRGAGRYADAAMVREAHAVGEAGEGTRNQRLNQAAFNLGQLVEAGQLSEPEVVRALTDAALAAGLGADPNCGEQGIAATIRSGLAAGRANPRPSHRNGTTPRPTPAGASAPSATPEQSGHDTVTSGPIVTCLSDVQPQAIAWLWPGRIPLGCLTLLVGRPGCGKSFLTCDIAARVSTGSPWPDGAGFAPLGGVLVVSAEVDPANTIRPRLDAHKADVKRIHHLALVQETDAKTKETRTRMFTLVDLPMLEEALRTLNAPRLVVIDPIGSFLGGAVDVHRDNQTRAALAPVDQMAKRFGCAVLVVMHTRKAPGANADDSALGSRAFVGLARAVHHVRADPDDDDRRLFLPGKTNLARRPDTRAFTIEGEPAKLAWEPDPVDISADEVEAVAGKPGPTAKARQAAMEFLTELLQAGPMAAKDVIEAAQLAGHAQRTLQRAASALGLVRQRDGYQGNTTWSLPVVPTAPQAVAAWQPGTTGGDGTTGGAGDTTVGQSCQDDHTCQDLQSGENVARLANTLLSDPAVAATAGPGTSAAGHTCQDSQARQDATTGEGVAQRPDAGAQGQDVPAPTGRLEQAVGNSVVDGPPVPVAANNPGQPPRRTAMRIARNDQGVRKLRWGRSPDPPRPAA